MSFGSNEYFFQVFQESSFTTPDGHIGGSGLPGGVTFMACTGDKGAPGWYPAYSPNVLAVGGTTLYLDELGNYQSEAAFVGRNAREEWLPGARGALVPPSANARSLTTEGAQGLPRPVT